MESRLTKLEVIIPTLVIKKDLVELELKLEKTIRAEVVAIHQEIGGMHKEMRSFQKNISALVMKSMIIMISISSAMIGIALATK